jgi:hypothetical protein
VEAGVGGGGAEGDAAFGGFVVGVNPDAGCDDPQDTNTVAMNERAKAVIGCMLTLVFNKQ